MARRFWSALAVLCFVVVGLVAQPPSSSATTPASWPARVATTWDAVVTANQTSEGAYVASCGNTIGKDQLTRLDKNGSQFPVLSNSSVMGAACAPDLLLDDGTMLVNRYPTAATSELSAWKNGRQLWALDTTGSTNCSVSGAASYGTTASGVAVSPDSQTLYTIFNGGASTSSCVDTLVGLDRATGTVDMFFPLYSGVQPTTLATPKVWTYADKLIVLDRTQTIRELSYAGTENTSAAYQFPDAWLTPAAYSTADSFGTVFVTGNQGGDWTNNKLRWYNAEGESGTVSYSLGYAPAQIVSDGMGSVYFLDAQAQKVKTLNLDTETLDEHPLALHSGGFPVAYTQDTAGNGLVVQTYMDGTTGERVTDISVIDGNTNTATSQADFRQDTSDSSVPNAYEYSTSNLATMVAGGYLYYPFCEAANSACYNAGGVELVVQRIELSGFGTPARSDNTRTAVEDDRLEYVALGDSFSSGEGVHSFTPGTDRDDISATNDVNEENRCHRSEYAYPMLLEEDEDLNLNLTAFVACSGATTETVLNGGDSDGSWGEGAQIDALSTSTDVVTITIGGNDVGFKEFMTECFTGFGDSCDVSSAVYSTTGSNIMNLLPGKLLAVYQSIQSKLGVDNQTAKVYVVGYPSIISDLQLTAASPWSCIYGLSSGDLAALSSLATDINSVTSNALDTLDDPRFTFVDPMSGNASFSNHDMCSEDWIIYPYDVGHPRERVAHPTRDGHEVLGLVIKEEMEE